MNIFENVRSFLMGRRKGFYPERQVAGGNNVSNEEACRQMLMRMQALCNAVPGGNVFVDVSGNEICIRLRWEAEPTAHEAFSMNGSDNNVTVYKMADESDKADRADESDKAYKAYKAEKAGKGEEGEEGDVLQEDNAKKKGGMMSRLARFLMTHYAFRYNVLTEQTECARIKEGDDNAYRIFMPAVPRLLNGISMDAMEAGIKCWDKDVRRFVESDRIESYHPFRLYFNNLPEWDGHDRVTELARRVSNEDVWVNGFHRWMLGVTAQWMGFGDSQRANSVAPILVSANQGWGKSTFCRMLMPPVLSRYFTESYDLAAPSSAERKLAAYGLINLDEFDKLSPKKLPLLKNLMQMESLNIRKAYRQCAEPLERLASFIGTSNRRDLLHDTTGSRRFLCVELERPIDCSFIDYEQLYAQLKHELESGERYWFSKREEADIQKHNRPFYCASPLEEVFHSCFEFAEQDEDGAKIMTAAEIYKVLKQANPAAMRGTTCNALSRLLPTLGKRVHTKYCNGYFVKGKV